MITTRCFLADIGWRFAWWISPHALLN